ncbi:MAG: 4Fe-4S dicluster domain-containing protein, partial [Ignavibacteria bacterium]|nr:4Fe-4S dicluster domain-containing protein [Ignavibacteria bacterium]
RYEWGSLNPRVQKCIMCYTLVEEGLPTACSSACPTGATKFGDRDELIKEAYQRIKDNPGQYYPYIYGDDEVGGTSVLFISPVPFEDLKFRANVPKQPLPDFTWAALEKIPSVVVVGAVALSGFYWLTNRKNEIAREKYISHNEGEKDEE